MGIEQPGHGQRRALSPVRCRSGHQPGQVAAIDVLILQAGRIAFQMHVAQFDDAPMSAMPADAVEEFDFLAQRACGRLVDAELEGDGRRMGPGLMAGLPDLAEAAHAQQLLDDQIGARHRLGPRLKARHPLRQQLFEVLGTAQQETPRGTVRPLGVIGPGVQRALHLAGKLAGGRSGRHQRAPLAVGRPPVLPAIARPGRR